MHDRYQQVIIRTNQDHAKVTINVSQKYVDELKEEGFKFPMTRITHTLPSTTDEKDKADKKKEVGVSVVLPRWREYTGTIEKDEKDKCEIAEFNIQTQFNGPCVLLGNLPWLPIGWLIDWLSHRQWSLDVEPDMIILYCPPKDSPQAQANER